jgi:hypothetical protein
MIMQKVPIDQIIPITTAAMERTPLLAASAGAAKKSRMAVMIAKTALIAVEVFINILLEIFVSTRNGGLRAAVQSWVAQGL